MGHIISHSAVHVTINIALLDNRYKALITLLRIDCGTNYIDMYTSSTNVQCKNYHQNNYLDPIIYMIFKQCLRI